MPSKRRSSLASARARKLKEATEILIALGFTGRQCNEVAGYSFLALLDLKPAESWVDVNAPLRGITPIITFIGEFYRIHYAPNTRETIRDEAVKHFAEAGILVRNPDDLARPTNSGKTVYQVEAHALALLRSYGGPDWSDNLVAYLQSREQILVELGRRRSMVRIPVTLPDGTTVSLSPGGQNPLIKSVIEDFCSRFVPGGLVLYIGDAEDKFLYLDVRELESLGVNIPPSAKMPDIVLYDVQRNWLVLIEAVASAGPVDGKRRSELKQLFRGCTAGLVFITAFASRDAMRSFVTQISWETEVWIAEDPDHLVHFDGERFLGPYPDVVPSAGA
jgi:hypothetical protein